MDEFSRVWKASHPMMLVDVQSEQSWSLDKEVVLIYNIYFCVTWFGHYIIPIFLFLLFFIFLY